ncbi:MAG: hypothetical protein ACRDKF_10165 [Actinomycetota bacterium]
MFIGLIIVAIAIVAFDLLVYRFGYDSRDGSDWKSHADETLDRAGRAHG